MDDLATVVDAPCREVSAEEIAHYRAFGWVKLKRFVHPDIVRLLLDRATRRMGTDGDSNDPYGLNQSYFNAEYAGGLEDETIRGLIDGVGRNAKKMMVRRGVDVRYFTDFFAPKLPSSRETRNAGNGITDFHQDFITFGVDRTGGLTFWMALEDYGPESGTMSFISKSHELGVTGSYHKGDARVAYPELLDLETTEAMSYAPGDVTVHSHLTVHGAGLNLTDRPRWAYLILLQPSDACYNGGYSEVMDVTRLKQDDQLPDHIYPIIG